MVKVTKLFFSPINDVASIGGGGGKVDTTDERKAFDTDLGGKKDDKETPKSDDKDEDKGTEEVEDDTQEEDTDSEEQAEEVEEDEEKPEEDEEEEPEELEGDTLYQKIKEYDPKILKKVPELRQVIFREQKFTELVGSIEEAQQLVDTSNTFNMLQQETLEGKSDNLLKALHKSGDGVFENYLSNLLPTVKEISKDAYYGMISPAVKELLRAAAKSPDERIAKAAENIHYFLFNDFNINQDVGLVPKKKSDKESEVERKEREFNQKVYTAFASDCAQTGAKRVRFDISKSLENIGLSPLTTKHMTEEIFSRVSEAMNKDARHMSNMEGLWKNAGRTGYTTEGKDRIINAYRSRAKVLISKYRQQVIAESKLSGKQVTDSKGREKKRVPVSGASGSGREYSGGKVDASKVDWNKTDERAMLDGKMTLKS